MKITKEEIYGYIGSAIFCLLIFIFLRLAVMYTTIKAEEDALVLNFVDVEWASGTFESKRGEPEKVEEPNIPKPKPKPKSVPQVETKVVVKQKAKESSVPPITQNREKTVAIETAQKKEDEKKRLEAEKLAQQKKAEEEQRKRNAINQQVTDAFNSKTNDQKATASTNNPIQSNTQTTSSGSSGSPGSSSTSSSGSSYGEFNLGGRTLGAGGLPRPAYTVQEEGRIVINITVNPSGNVIFVEIGRGTNIDNANMRKSALDAAQKAKFNSISGNNNQSGTITYKYSLK